MDVCGTPVRAWLKDWAVRKSARTTRFTHFGVIEGREACDRSINPDQGPRRDRGLRLGSAWVVPTRAKGLLNFP